MKSKGNMSKKCFCMALTLITAASLTACGSGSADSRSDNSQTQKVQETAANTTKAANTQTKQNTTAAQQPKQSSAAATQAETTPELLAIIEKMQPYLGSFKYEEYYCSDIGNGPRKIGGIAMLNFFDNKLKLTLPRESYTIPVEKYSEIAETGTLNVEIGINVISVTWSEDKDTITFKNGRKNSDMIVSEGSAVRVKKRE